MKWPPDYRQVEIERSVRLERLLAAIEAGHDITHDELHAPLTPQEQERHSHKVDDARAVAKASQRRQYHAWRPTDPRPGERPLLQARLGDALMLSGIQWLEPGVTPARLYWWVSDDEGVTCGGASCQFDFAWQDRSIGIKLAVHFKEPPPPQGTNNNAICNVAVDQGWRLIQPDTLRADWIAETVTAVRHALRGTRWLRA